MFLYNKVSASTIEITDLDNLFNPLRNEVEGQTQEGQEEQDPEAFAKQDLAFASGEPLPRCWVDPDYRTK
ncbi:MULTISPECIES: acetyltransferase [unclassified Chamaesiphon]|uniref:acetyltransferase n=1 Tax=unclassified Chamaesiphon TaxID=2620921 RepID=UPI00286BBEE4|nr:MULTISPECIES: acetyltransferase [unclassified Chamaesiphon]